MTRGKKDLTKERLSEIWKGLPLKVILHQRLSPTNGHSPWRSSCIKSCLASKVVFRQGLSSIKGRFLLKVVFRQRSSSVKGHIPSKVVILFWVIFIFVQRRVPSSNVQVIFCQRSSSVKGRLSSKVVLHLRPSSIESRLPLLGHFHFLVLILSVT